jgi:hypothetical protein
MNDQSFGGWPADAVRAFLTWFLCVGGVLFTYVLLYVLSWFGLALMIITVIFGPFLAAKVACLIVPADRPLTAALGWGIILGLVFFSIFGVGILKAAERRHWHGDFTDAVVGLIVAGPLLVALLFSRLRRLSSD